MQAHTVCKVLVSPPFIASNREREISAHATATQAGSVDHFITAVSRFNIRTFTAQPLTLYQPMTANAVMTFVNSP